MKRNLIYIYSIIVVAFFASMVSSCEVQDFDWEEARQNNPDYKYEQVCKSVFGEVAPDQSWDFSGYAGGEVPSTRGTNDAVVCTGSKRYMVEDLSTNTETSIGGYKSDIDFNDIVVDFYQFSDGTQKAIVRAMGGTLDFMLFVGGNPVFQKSADGFAPEIMYNTGISSDKGGYGNGNIDYGYGSFLKEIPLLNGQWDPVRNNISFHLLTNLEGMDRPNSESGSDPQVYEISFPDPGTVAPRIIALPTEKRWMPERVEIDFINKSYGTENLTVGFSVNITPGTGGTAEIISSAPDSKGLFYRPVQIKAFPNSNYEFVHWSDGSTAMERLINYDVDLYVYFTEKESIGGNLWEGDPVSVNNGSGVTLNHYLSVEESRRMLLEGSKIIVHYNNSGNGNQQMRLQLPNNSDIGTTNVSGGDNLTVEFVIPDYIKQTLNSDWYNFNVGLLSIYAPGSVTILSISVE